MKEKPLGKKSYGSIPHLSDSKLGKSEKKVTIGQERIATCYKRDKHDIIICQEKLDGSNVGVAKIDGKIVALTRAGYLAEDSHYELHHVFGRWVIDNISRFNHVLDDGERICGEWLYQAHGTKYDLPHEPFVAFDMILGDKRLVFSDLKAKLCDLFTTPHVINDGESISVRRAMGKLGKYGFHGALEPCEGAVWRVERKGVVDFLCKYVRPGKVDGKYIIDYPETVINTFKPYEKKLDF